MTIKEALVELELALMTNDKRWQEELFIILENKGMGREESKTKAFNIYLRGE